MSIDDLEQALLEAKWDDAEVDEYEVIGRLLELDRQTVLRVEFALHAVTEARILRSRPFENCLDGHSQVPENVRNALSTLIRRGLLRVRVRECIRDEESMFTHVNKLVADPSDVCAGCPFAIPCLTENLSTPAKCHERGVPERMHPEQGGSLMRRFDGGSKVFPRKLKKDKVTFWCEHPRGEFTLDIGDLWP